MKRRERETREKGVRYCYHRGEKVSFDIRYDGDPEKSRFSCVGAEILHIHSHKGERKELRRS